MPITRSRTSSEQSAPEVAVSTDGEHKEPVATAKESPIKSAPAESETKSNTTNGCPRVAPSEGDKVVDDEKKEVEVDQPTEDEAPVAGEADGEAVKEGDKETAASQTVEKAADAGTEATEAAANGCSRSAVTDGDGKTSDVKENVNQVQEAEAKAPTGDVCAKRKPEDSDVPSEADSTCKKNKVDGEAAEPVATH